MRSTTFQWLALQGLASIICLLVKRGSPEYHGRVATAIQTEAAKLKELEGNEDAVVQVMAKYVEGGK